MTHKIRDGISKTLREIFPDCQIFGDKHVGQGLIPSSFFVGLGECSTSPLPNGLTKLRQHVEVIYFPKSQGDYSELWSIAPKALGALEQIPFGEDGLIRGTSRRCTINDGLLHLHAIYHLRLVPREAIELMGELRQIKK